MKITLLFFGILKDIIGDTSKELQVTESITVDGLKTHLLQKYKELTNFSNFSIAVNEEYVKANDILKTNDVVALIPPVSGG